MRKLVISAIGLALLSLASCGKKDATTLKELDGEWKMVELNEIKEVTEKDKGKIVERKIFETTVKNNKLEIAETYKDYYSLGEASETDDYTGSQEVTLSFDKSNGTYSKTISINKDCIRDIKNSEDRKIGTETLKITSEEKEEGNFFLNQKSGDNSKGTMIVFTPTKINGVKEIISSTEYIIEKEPDGYKHKQEYSKSIDGGYESNNYSGSYIGYVSEASRKSLSLIVDVTYSTSEEFNNYVNPASIEETIEVINSSIVFEKE